MCVCEYPNTESGVKRDMAEPPHLHQAGLVQGLVPDLEAVCPGLVDVFTFIVIVSKNEICF